MKTNLFLSIVLSLITFFSQAAINPEYKECMQRGYSIDGDHCVFPDGTKCLIKAFNDGTCGQNFMTTDYCIPEGKYVWDSDRCCEGLSPYLKQGMDGQETCHRKETILKREFQNSKGLWLLIGGLVILFVLLKMTGRRRRKK